MKLVRIVLTGSGLFLAGLGIFFIVAPPPGEEGMVRYLPAAMCLLFSALTFKLWLPMVKSVDHSYVLQHGEPTMATLVTARGTATRINHEPVYKFTLDVEGTDGQTHRATIRQIVSITSIGWLRSGVKVPVRIDPDNPLNVALDSRRFNEVFGSGAMPPEAASVVSLAGPAAGRGVVRSADVIRDGVGSEATVQSVSLTGKTFGQMAPKEADESIADDPMVVLALQVSGTGGATFTARGTYRVPKDKLTAMAPGGTVPVAYMPNDPTGTTSVDWDRF